MQVQINIGFIVGIRNIMTIIKYLKRKHRRDIEEIMKAYWVGCPYRIVSRGCITPIVENHKILNILLDDYDIFSSFWYG
jgi:hypothetical protein